MIIIYFIIKFTEAVFKYKSILKIKKETISITYPQNLFNGLRIVFKK
jgi:hypothetical protein